MKETAITENIVREALKAIQDPHLGIDLVSSLVVQNIKIEQDMLHLALRLGYPAKSYQETLKNQIESELKSLLDIAHIKTDVTSRVNTHVVQKSMRALPGIKNIIAIASGKGGVGKSTVACNLALAIQAEGAKVGILDADIYGPSQPKMLGVTEKPGAQEKRLMPVISHGLKTMSIGYLVEENTPTVWRGPMVSSALQQLLNDTEWGELDYLIIDLPPGTGDIQLTLAQKIPVSGVVVVTTPQEIALMDARKAIMMFRKVGVSVLGIIENMSAHVCRHCGHEEAIFGSNGAAELAKQYEIPLLGDIPLDSRIREKSDLGEPIVVFEPDSSITQRYLELARSVTAQLSLRPRDLNLSFQTQVKNS